ncbi:PEP/pyruvate-binding domain-containing protein [Streptomyces globisporus]|uniref:PEP/pyruvate-binding domain-containing protein n=1 Tax=Streptomyces globisporus TaxID=1908 RepID=UPI00099BBA3A
MGRCCRHAGDGGGKGAAPSELARGGLPVPGGFPLTAAAYQEFVASTGVADRIRAELSAASGPDAASDTGAGVRIRALFEEGPLHAAPGGAVSKAYAELGIPAVVGRGHATTWIRTGDRIRVDVGHGTVDVLETATAAPEPVRSWPMPRQVPAYERMS